MIKFVKRLGVSVFQVYNITCYLSYIPMHIQMKLHAFLLSTSLILMLALVLVHVLMVKTHDTC
ncbi:hypothetical protein GIB67_009845 [Kingdonia uniflora]|uniref:Uncharacterized protein n=1 Tax=Kingdonia uniflora TaxID=39325 RepID=A0A7J7LMZ9_9MAGN|nr:hypothetical protein GIB67_009845 [Kingdonia uniflora]